MLVDSRGKYFSRFASCINARLFGAVCGALVLAVAGSAQAQLPSGFGNLGSVDNGTGINLTPAIATDGNNNWVAVWASNETPPGAPESMEAEGDILFSSSVDNGVSWSAAAALNNDAFTDADVDASPRVATNGAIWVTVWSDGPNVSAATSPTGLDWGNPINLGAGGDPGVAVDSTGDSVAVAENGGNIIAIHTAQGGGATNTVGAGANPDIGVDNLPANNWLAAFELGTEIGVAVSPDGEVWGATVTVDSPGTAAAGPRVGFDPLTGNWFVFWASDDTNIYFSFSTDSGANWSAAAVVGGDAIFPDANVSIANDGNSAWVAVWRTISNQTVFAGSADNGAAWSAPVVVEPATDTLNVTGEVSRLLGPGLREIIGGRSVNPNVATDGKGFWITLSEIQAPAGGERELSFAQSPRAAGDDDDNDGPCFIASAAYGTPMDKDIEVLRDLRDSYMMNNAVGLLFVDAYYQVSPVIADQVAQNPWMASLVRVLLTPVLLIAELFMRAPVPFLLVGIFAAAMMIRTVARRRTA